MRIQLGMVACMLAGCATQHDAPASASVTQRGAELPPGHPATLRISLEFLPPDERFTESEPILAPAPTKRHRRVRAEQRAVQTVTLRTQEPSVAPDLSKLDFASIDDPVARETLRFCSDLIAADRRRVRREVGIPFFDFRPGGPEVGPLLTSERRLREDHERWSQDLGVALLKQPLRLTARRLPAVRDVELALHDFRSDQVPWTAPQRQERSDRRELGRLSLRLNVRELGDPAEVVYIHPLGLRVGSNQRRAKLALDLDLSERIHVALRARTDYDTGQGGVRADLIYRPSPRASVHLAAGDDMDFLSSSAMYSLFESPMDGAPGLVLYVVHTF